VQSFDTQLRRSLGREANTEKIAETVRMVSGSGIQNLCIDLIYNLPGQSLSIWESDLEHLKQLPLTGCSIYPLVLPPNSSGSTEFIELSQNIGFQWQLFQTSDTFLCDEIGWESFSAVQYGHPITGKARYISAQASSYDMLGFGPSAGSRAGNLIWNHPPDLIPFSGDSPDYFSDSTTVMRIDENFNLYQPVFGLSENNRIAKPVVQKLPDELKLLVFDLINKNMVIEKESTFELTRLGKFWALNLSELFATTIYQFFR